MAKKTVRPRQPPQPQPVAGPTTIVIEQAGALEERTFEPVEGTFLCLPVLNAPPLIDPAGYRRWTTSPTMNDVTKFRIDVVARAGGAVRSGGDEVAVSAVPPLRAGVVPA